MVLALIEAVFQRVTRGESCEDLASVFVTWMEMLKRFQFQFFTITWKPWISQSVAVVFHSSFLDFSWIRDQLRIARLWRSANWILWPRLIDCMGIWIDKWSNPCSGWRFNRLFTIFHAHGNGNGSTHPCYSIGSVEKVEPRKCQWLSVGTFLFATFRIVHTRFLNCRCWQIGWSKD
jgi:hypothetical protein